MTVLLNETCGRLVAAVLDRDDVAAANELAAALCCFRFCARRSDTDVVVELGVHEVLITARQIRQVALGAIAVSDESMAVFPICSAVRAQLHIIAGLLVEVAECGGTHALLEVTR